MIRTGAPSPVVSIASLRCACGSSKIARVSPGSLAEIAPGGFVVQRGVAAFGTCLACWPMARGHQQELFGAPPE